jgi:gas vesicle protein
MAYNFYQNSKMVSQQINANQEQYEQNQEAKINDNINQYRNEQFNYKVALNQEQQVEGEIEDQNKISGVSDIITSGFELPAGVNSIKNAYQKVKQVYNNLGKTVENAKSVANDLSDTIQSNVSDVVSNVSDTIDNTVNALSSASSKIQNAVTSTAPTSAPAPSPAVETPTITPTDSVLQSPTGKTIDEQLADINTSPEGKVFDNPLYGEDLNIKSFSGDIGTTETKLQFGSTDYTGAQASSVPQPVLPTEQPASSTSGILESNQEIGLSKTPQAPQEVSYKVEQGSEADLSSIGESAAAYTPATKVSEVVPDAEGAAEEGGGLFSKIFGGIGDVFEGIGDVLDPVVGLASLGAGIYGAVEGAKHLEDGKPDLPAPPAPPAMVTDFVPQANIASTAQPGV